MNTKPVEVILHVNDSLAETDRNEIVTELQNKVGVSHAHFTPDRPHLCVVDYDPDCLHATDLLSSIREKHFNVERIS